MVLLYHFSHEHKEDDALSLVAKQFNSCLTKNIRLFRLASESWDQCHAAEGKCTSKGVPKLPFIAMEVLGDQLLHRGVP